MKPVHPKDMMLRVCVTTGFERYIIHSTAWILSVSCWGWLDFLMFECVYMFLKRDSQWTVKKVLQFNICNVFYFNILYIEVYSYDIKSELYIYELMNSKHLNIEFSNKKKEN